MHLKDNKIHKFDKNTSDQIKQYIPIKQCNFCRGKIFLPNAMYYKHDGGWKTSLFDEKIWIYITCKKCGHEWSLTHLGVKRNVYINIK